MTFKNYKVEGDTITLTKQELSEAAHYYWQQGGVYESREQTEKDLMYIGMGNMLSDILKLFNANGEHAHWQKNLWKDAQGDELPEIEREVVAFQTITNDELIEMVGPLRVVIAHRPNPEGWDGKSLSTGKVEHYTPKTYDKGGWNMEGVTYWLDVELPEGIE